MMSQVLKFCLVVFLGSFASGSVSHAGVDTFESPTTGFQIEKPDGWVYASMATIEENRSRVRLNDAKLEEGLRKYATAPLVMITRYPEPHPTLNPTIQITLRPLGDLSGQSPTEIMSLTTEPLSKAFSDFRFIEEPGLVKVSELEGAHMRAQYTVRTAEGGEFPVTARMWLIPRGTMMFLIGMSGPQEGPDVSEAEFVRAFESISIEK